MSPLRNHIAGAFETRYFPLHKSVTEALEDGGVCPLPLLHDQIESVVAEAREFIAEAEDKSLDLDRLIEEALDTLHAIEGLLALAGTRTAIFTHAIKVYRKNEARGYYV